MTQIKEEVNTFHMTPNTNIFINKIVDFESQSPYYPNAPRNYAIICVVKYYWGELRLQANCLVSAYELRVGIRQVAVKVK